MAYGLPALAAPNAQATDRAAMTSMHGGGTPGIPDMAQMRQFIAQRQAAGNQAASPRTAGGSREAAKSAIGARKPKLAGQAAGAPLLVPPPKPPLRDTLPKTPRDLSALYSAAPIGRELRRASEGRI